MHLTSPWDHQKVVYLKKIITKNDRPVGESDIRVIYYCLLFLFEFKKSNQTRKNACISHYSEVGGFEQINGGQGTEEAERKLVVRCINQDPSQSPGAVGGLGLPDTIGW